jgi:mandelate racemase
MDAQPKISTPSLTLRGIHARAVILPLRRPIVARIATIREWPVVLIDFLTEEGLVGRSYLEPYAPNAMKVLVAMLRDLETPLSNCFTSRPPRNPSTTRPD